MKMHHHKKLLLFILQVILLSIHFPFGEAATGETPITYRALNPNQPVCNGTKYASCIGPSPAPEESQGQGQSPESAPKSEGNATGGTPITYGAQNPNKPFCNRNTYSSCIGRSPPPEESQGQGQSPESAPKSQGNATGGTPISSGAQNPNQPSCDRNVYGSCIGARPAPEESQGQGQSPESPPESKGNGIPPVQSLSHAPAPISDGKGSYHPSKHGNLPPLVATLLGITGMVTISMIIYCFHKRRRLLKNPNLGRNQQLEMILLQHGSLAPKRYKYSQIKKITKSFSDKLGQGGYGSVYKGILPNGCLVAVKVLVETDSNGEEFINEVASISRTSHVNIVNLLGFCYDQNKRALVYEFMPNKSLDTFISSSACCRLDTEKLYKIALGVAKGLEYLHAGCNTRIVHFDIKPQNILLDEDFCPKISDFGLAKLCKKKQSIISMIGARGTIGYIAPEIFSRNFGGVSYKSDVYSYGMMILEMAGARNIVETVTVRSSENYFPDKIYEEVILNVTRKLDDCMIEEEDDRTRKMFLVGFWCIQTTPSVRPSMSKVVEMLEGSLHSIQIPPKPFLFSPNLTGKEFTPSLSVCEEIENSAVC